MSLLLITLFSFLAAVSLIVILFMLPMAVQDSPQARIKRRLTAIGRLDYASKRRFKVFSKLRSIARFLGSIELFSRSSSFAASISVLERANVDMTPGLFLLCSCRCRRASPFFSTFILGQSTLHCFIFALIAIFCPYVYLQLIIWKRLRKFLEQFPDGLDMISPEPSSRLGADPGDGFCRQRNAGSDGHGILSLY